MTTTQQETAVDETEETAPDTGTRPAGGREITLRVPSLAGVRRAAAAPGRLAGRWGRGDRGRTALRVVVGVLLVAVLAATAWVVTQQREAQALADARRDAVAAAQQRVPAMLGYDFSTLADDVARANAQTTGEFHDDYAQILDEVVTPHATESQVTTEATVTTAAVVSGGTDDVVVLVFLTQSTLTGGSETPQISGSRVEVTMTEVDGDWLVSALEPV